MKRSWEPWLILATAALFIAALFAPIGPQVSAQAYLATVTGHLIYGTGNAASKNVFVRFRLANYGSNWPHVVSTGELPSPTPPDFYPVDATGLIAGTIIRNDFLVPAGSFWHVCAWQGSVEFRCADYAITSASFNLDTAIPITTVPVTPPPSPSDYFRLDHACLDGSRSVLYANPVNFIGCASGFTFSPTNKNAALIESVAYPNWPSFLVRNTDATSGKAGLVVGHDAPAISGARDFELATDPQGLGHQNFLIYDELVGGIRHFLDSAGRTIMGPGIGLGSAEPSAASGALDVRAGSNALGVTTDTAINAGVGYRINGAAVSGRYPKGNGTNFVQSSGAASGTGACGANQAVGTLNADAAPGCVPLPATFASKLLASVMGSTSNPTQTSATPAVLAEMTATVTVDSGANVWLLFQTVVRETNVNDSTAFQFYRGSTAIGPVAYRSSAIGSQNESVSLSWVDPTPAAGSTVYSVKWNNSGSNTSTADLTNRTLQIVEIQ